MAKNEKICVSHKFSNGAKPWGQLCDRCDAQQFANHFLEDLIICGASEETSLVCYKEESGLLIGFFHWKVGRGSMSRYVSGFRGECPVGRERYRLELEKVRDVLLAGQMDPAGTIGRRPVWGEVIGWLEDKKLTDVSLASGAMDPPYDTKTRRWTPEIVDFGATHGNTLYRDGSLGWINYGPIDDLVKIPKTRI
jgi:hypothetical protein